MQVRLTQLFMTIVLGLPAVGLAQAHVHGSQDVLGDVSFHTSCATAVQPQFNRAVALMHSFQFAGAIDGFHSILSQDPTCAMANWGIALSNWGNPFAAGLKPQAQLESGLRAVESARAIGPKTERERGYVEAVAKLYTDSAHLDQRSRILAYESAMASVSAANPEDNEAAIFYALAIAAAADPADKTYARQLKAGAILEALFVQYPNHPGLAHYIIHTYDVPPLASRAAEAARRYSEIAPSTAHALHMPSHTFTRTGDWPASIEANLASVAAARHAAQLPDELHATDYLVYAYLQTAQDTAARQWMESAAQTFSRYEPSTAVGGAASSTGAYFAHAAIPARYSLERRAWADAAKLEVLSSPFPYTDALTYFARGMGAAHLRDRAATLSAIDSLGTMRDKLIVMKESYWANQVEIQRQEIAAWFEFSFADRKSALEKMRAVAQMEDKTEKNVVTPGPLAPAHELLGELLLESKRPADALQEFKTALTKDPNRFWSMYGAAEAAKQAGDRSTAQTYFQTLLKVAAGAGGNERPELAEARAETHTPGVKSQH